MMNDCFASRADALENDWRRIVLLRFQLDDGNGLRRETLVAHPLGVHLLRQHHVGGVSEARATTVEPEVTPTLTEDRLVVVLYLQAEQSASCRRGQ